MLNFDQKGVIYFWQSVGAILKDVSVAKTIAWGKNINQKTSTFHCSEIYSNPTNVTQYKVAVNMANLKSLMNKRSYP